MGEQKTMVLTGASRGIGHATVKRFSREGWRVLTCSRQPFDPRCPWPGGEENHIQVDLANPDMTIRAIEAIKDKIDGRLHALVNNAGVSPKGPKGERLSTITTDLRTWGQVFHVNFFACVVLARGLQEELTAGKGSIVNVTSIAGSRVHPFAGAAYATSKAALAALTREMAHDFGPLGVRVNALAPGEVETAILSPGTDKIVEKLPLQRLGQPSEVADAIWFLCSDQSSYISGAEIEVNGAQHV
ncbi:SDR family oxidoreductase [Cereibacter sphaeroides]|uniref:SDR family oxidoreductase n=2 Tax=Cereibacter sphaeroides TaxID=1063 RepID=A0AAX1UKV7_CERSP|nr:short-chain dehydrogenase/reductase SDR [Cereibacter sphaeroides ATCC 17029]AZB56772.1 SDR family oxidoreductase [Cereibacter sphaeroides]EGJ22568.1 short-chain dehydrogenase/reductase SDR [Cereibacter sphaeroides WS8N]AZB61046.1 SDR family oxidoreductase [Cereibacter sphaeroides]AZB65192.1 SDR family oxidoreductase [Cereibacter sphaeroides]